MFGSPSPFDELEDLELYVKVMFSRLNLLQLSDEE